jgi:type I restriction enzyme S subunit
VQCIGAVEDSVFEEFRSSARKFGTRMVSELLLEGPTNGFSPQTSDDGNAFTVSLGAIKNGRFSPGGNTKRAKVDDSVLSKFDVREGDVFIVRGNGNRVLCGRAGLSTETIPNLFYPDLLIRLRFNEKLMDPEFATYQWNHPIAHSHLLQWAKSTNGIWKINGSDIKRQLMVLPPLSEQKRILNDLKRIESRLEIMKKSMSDLAHLRASLVNQIF